MPVRMCWAYGSCKKRDGAIQLVFLLASRQRTNLFGRAPPSMKTILEIALMTVIAILWVLFLAWVGAQTAKSFGWL
jgi:hypothetical protein